MTTRRVARAAGWWLGVMFSSLALAQTSSSFKLENSVLNAGGHPEAGTVLAGPSFRITLDALGDGLIASELASPSWRMDEGFVSAYPPPEEIAGVIFGADHTTLTWRPERSVGTYALYRGIVPAFLPTYGVCLQSGLSVGNAVDIQSPPAGSGFFYLATVRNRLGEEGTKGFASSGTPRANPSPCP